MIYKKELMNTKTKKLENDKLYFVIFDNGFITVEWGRDIRFYNEKKRVIYFSQVWDGIKFNKILDKLEEEQNE